MAKMRISPELKKLIEKYRCVKDTEGMSPAIDTTTHSIKDTVSAVKEKIVSGTALLF